MAVPFDQIAHVTDAHQYALAAKVSAATKCPKAVVAYDRAADEIDKQMETLTMMANASPFDTASAVIQAMTNPSNVAAAKAEILKARAACNANLATPTTRPVAKPTTPGVTPPPGLRAGLGGSWFIWALGGVALYFIFSKKKR